MLKLCPSDLASIDRVAASLSQEIALLENPGVRAVWLEWRDGLETVRANVAQGPRVLAGPVAP